MLLFALLVALWFFAHPHLGLLGDAVFYALQALGHLHPETYGKDLFFLYGSQDDFTLFSPIYGAFIRLFGLDGAMSVLLLAGYALWLGSAMLLAGRMLRGFAFWFGLVMVIAMPRSVYGDVLEYADRFLTARLIAEALTLLAIALLLKEKRLAALTTLVFAFAVHPLMTLAGAGFVALYLACDRPREYLVAGALASGVIAFLGWMNIPPFSRLFTVMDAEWLRLAMERSHYVFWDGWRYDEWGNRALLSFSLLAAAAIAAQGRQRRIFLLPMVIGTLALLLFWFGTSVVHNVLLIQMQTWRWLWLPQMFSYLAAAWLTGELWARNRTCRLLLLGFVTAWLTLDSVGGPLAVLTCMMLIWHLRHGQAIPDWLTGPFYALPVAAAGWWLANAYQEATLSAHALMQTPASSAIEFGLVWVMRFLSTTGGVVSILILLAIWHYGSDRRKPVHLAAVAGVVFLLLLSLVFWDRQNQQQRYYAHQALRDAIPSFSRLIPAGAVVYWEDDVQMTWFGLGRASYASLAQTVGLIFSRETAIEGNRRTARLAAMGIRDGNFSPASQRTAPRRDASFAGLVHLCHDPALDFVVLSTNFSEASVSGFRNPMTGRYFYLYDCAGLRKHHPDTWATTASPRSRDGVL